MRFLAIIIAICASLPAQAQDTGLVTLQTRNDSKGWEAVGRLDISGKGFCTAALIQDQLILTAAHCVYDTDGSVIAADRFTFEAGLRDGRSEASRGVRRLLAHPDYQHSGPSADTSEVANDIAILELDQPIRDGRIKPFPIASRPRAGDQIGVVSYGKDRANAPSLQEICSVLRRQNGVLLMTCDINFGSSGAPVFRLENGQIEIVSVVSAMAEVNGEPISIGTSLQQPLATLLMAFENISAGGPRQIIVNGQRSEGGAKFVRP